MQIKTWVEQGYSLGEIAGLIGITKLTLHNWRIKYPDIREALEGVRSNCGDTKKVAQEKSEEDRHELSEKLVEDALLKRALGYTYMETTYERSFEDGEEKMIKKKQVEKQVMPDLSAQVFWLKNRCSARWKEKQETRWEEKDITVKLMDDEDED